MDISVIDKHFKVLNNLASSNYRLLLMEGSSRSGKTYAVLQYLLIVACIKQTNIVVARQSLCAVRKTIWIDLIDIVPRDLVTIDQSTLTVTFNDTGSTITCIGLDSPTTITADIGYIDEAHEVYMESYKWFSLGVDNVILSMNPAPRDHWIYDKLLSVTPFIYSHSTYKDNPYLSERVIQCLESYDPHKPLNVARQTADPYMWMRYGLGQRVD